MHIVTQPGLLLEPVAVSVRCSLASVTIAFTLNQHSHPSNAEPDLCFPAPPSCASPPSVRRRTGLVFPNSALGRKTRHPCGAESDLCFPAPPRAQAGHPCGAEPDLCFPIALWYELGPGKNKRMAYVIAEPCIGTKDTACVDACPVDCIHPKKDEPNHAEAEMLYIDPVECIDCGACVPVCPVSAIFALDDLPEKWNEFTAKNAAYYGK